MNELILRAQNGEKEALAELVDENVGLIWSIVRRFGNRNYELEDLFQIGSIGFIKAVKRFDTSFETKLSTYAVPMIIGEIRRFLRDNGPIKVSRSLKELAMKVREVQEKSEKEKGKELSMEEIGMLLNVDKEDIVLALEATSYIESIDKNIGDDDGYTVGDKISSNVDDYEKVVNGITLDKLLKTLDEKEQKVIFFRYYREMTQSQIADFLGTSQVQVSRIEKRALQKMHDKITI